jgi:hypothetical protein
VDEPTEGTSSENSDEKHNLMVGALNTTPITAMCFTGQDQVACYLVEIRKHN